MRKFALLFAVAAVALGVSAFVVAPTSTDTDGISWTTDYQAAVQQAADENKEILLFFTGSDWCGWCKRFDKDVLSKQEFIDYANENLVCVVLDDPRYTQIDQDLLAQTHNLARKYGVRGYPSFRLLDAQENLLHSMNGYQQGGPQAFIDQLNRFVSAP